MKTKQLNLIIDENYTQIQFLYINKIVVFNSKYGSFLDCQYSDTLYYSNSITFAFHIVKIY